MLHVVDTVVLWNGRVLLIERGREPHLGAFALPGGKIEQDEHPFDAAMRELTEETGLSVDPSQAAVWRDLETYDGYDPRGGKKRGHLFSLVIARTAKIRVFENVFDATSGEVRSLTWMPLDLFIGLKIAFDHRALIGRAIVATFQLKD